MGYIPFLAGFINNENLPITITDFMSGAILKYVLATQ
jgi:hypothetical protein